MEDTMTIPAGTDNGSENPSPEVQPGTQVPAESQVPAPAQVENGNNKPQAVEPQRVRPSDHYRERERYRRLEESNKTLLSRFEEMSNFIKELKNPKPEGQTAISKLTAEALLADPETVFQARDQRLLNEFNAIRQEINQLKGEKVAQERSNMEREALEMLFPKSGADDKSDVARRMQLNQDRADMIQKIIEDNPEIDEYSKINPIKAARLLLKEIGNMKPQASPNAIPKSLMGSTARGNPAGGSKQSGTVEDKMSELKKLSAEIERNPDLRYDKEHKKAREKLMFEIESKMQEKRG